MRKYAILFLIFLLLTFSLFAQEKSSKGEEITVRGKLERFSRMSLIVNGKEYTLPLDVLIKERVEGKNESIVVKEREEKLKPGIFEAVEEVSIVLVNGNVSEVIIEVVRK